MFYVSLGVILAGLVIFVVGRTVAKKRSVSFIAGYNTMFVPKDEAKLAKRIGMVISIFGVETVLFPIIYYYLNISTSVFVGLAVCNVLLILFFMLRDQMSANKE